MAGYDKLGETDHDLGPGWRRHNIDLQVGHFSFLIRAGNTPSFILIPGSFGDSFCLVEILDHLDGSAQLIVVEVRGHGGGWPPPMGCSIEEFGGDVLTVADQLRLDRYFVGGHSIGGMIALEVAKVRPQQVAGVISIEGWTSHHVLEEAFSGENAVTMTAGQIARNEILRARVLEAWSDREIAEFRRYWTEWDCYEFLCETDIPILESRDSPADLRTRRLCHLPQRPPACGGTQPLRHGPTLHHLPLWPDVVPGLRLRKMPRKGPGPNDSSPPPAHGRHGRHGRKLYGNRLLQTQRSDRNHHGWPGFRVPTRIKKWLCTS